MRRFAKWRAIYTLHVGSRLWCLFISTIFQAENKVQDLQSRLDTDHGAKAEIVLTLQNVQTKSGQLEKTVSDVYLLFCGTRTHASSFSSNSKIRAT